MTEKTYLYVNTFLKAKLPRVYKKLNLPCYNLIYYY